MIRYAITPPEVAVAVQLSVLATVFAVAAFILHVRGPRSVPAAVVKTVLLVMSTLAVATYYGALTSEVRLTEKHIAFKVPGFYGRVVPWTNVDFEGVRLADLDRDAELEPKLRTSGIGLWGFRVGWFQVSNGHMAWLAVTRPERVVVVPQLHGPVDIVSVTEPDALVHQLRRVGAALAHAAEADAAEAEEPRAERDESSGIGGSEETTIDATARQLSPSSSPAPVSPTIVSP